jgi:hypothetical protein
MNLAMKGFLFLWVAIACKGEPKRSYCEALCDWAVACNQEVRPDLDVEAETQECLDATRASDPSCAKAEDGTIDPASGKALDLCVTAIDEAAAAGECDAYNGSIEQVEAGAPPAECASQAGDYINTFHVGRDAAAESGAELCQRLTDTLCAKLSECILGDTEPPQEAVDALGGTPTELCVQRLEPIFTQDCISSGRYEPSEGLEPNVARDSAIICAGSVATAQCTDLIAAPPNLSPECAASFTTPEQALQVGEALVDIAGDYEEFVPAP